MTQRWVRILLAQMIWCGREWERRTICDLVRLEVMRKVRSIRLALNMPASVRTDTEAMVTRHRFVQRGLALDHSLRKILIHKWLSCSCSCR